MVNTSRDKLRKMGWLNQQKNLSSLSKLKIQKFLYFYEMFQKISDKKYDIENLKAYVNGPVFSKVYGDITYQESELLTEVENATFEDVDNKSAMEAFFLIDSMTDTELSKLTHQFDMWKSKKSRIDAGELQVPIEEKDITDRDLELLKAIVPSYPDENPDYHIIIVQEKHFILSEEDFKKLTDVHYNTLEALSNDSELINPVYIYVDGDEGLLVD